MFNKVDIESDNDKDKLAYLMSFLMILVHRNGGEIIVENLSEFANKKVSLSMDVDVENDKVVLKTEELPHIMQ